MGHSSAGPVLRCEAEELEPGTSTIRVAGEVDADSAARFQQELIAALERAERRLVVDLDAVTFFDSAGIRCLINLRQQADRRGREVVLVMPGRPSVRRALEISSLHHLFPIALSSAETSAPPTPSDPH